MWEGLGVGGVCGVQVGGSAVSARTVYSTFVFRGWRVGTGAGGRGLGTGAVGRGLGNGAGGRGLGARAGTDGMGPGPGLSSGQLFIMASMRCTWGVLHHQ